MPARTPGPAFIDSLEPRALLAATTSVSLSPTNGRLTIVGSAGDDKVEVALYGKGQARVYDGGVNVLTFDLDKAKSVSFAGGAGNDVLILGRVPLKLYAEGGTGDDAISASRGGSFSDTVYGQAGNDYLYGGPGDDTLDGGVGSDGIFGAEGNDYEYGLSDNTGDDTISGGDGTDTVDLTQYSRGVTERIGDRTPAVLTVDDFIFENVETILGTSYADNIGTVAGRPLTVFLGAGNDTFTGGRGNDTIYGGTGRDEIATAGGNDVIYDTDGAVNIINGGSGDDTAHTVGGSTITFVESLINDSTTNA